MIIDKVCIKNKKIKIKNYNFVFMLQSLVCKKNVKSIKPLDILAEMFIECLQRITHVILTHKYG